MATTTYPASFAEPAFVERVRANLAAVRARISSTGRDPSSVRIVAVTKTFSVDAVRAARAVGLSDVGENYADELCDKRHEYESGADDPAVRWHYLGALQSNKIARVVACAQVISGVSREKELALIARASPEHDIDVQVDFSSQPGRNGAPPQAVTALVARARELGLRPRGLMVVAPPGEVATRAAFRATAALAEDCGLRECSMGMSEDLEWACELGTTEVRLGRALFGPREGASPLA